MRKSINNKTKLYVAYGSNLHTGQMAHRCPDAKIIGSGVIKNYELFFAGWPGHGVATILQAEGHNVPVGVWAISERDEKALDIYEGWPALYRKEEIVVDMEDGSSLTAMVYIMNNRYRGEKMVEAAPTSGYYNTIATGYKTFGLDEKILEAALKRTKNL